MPARDPGSGDAGEVAGGVDRGSGTRDERAILVGTLGAGTAVLAATLAVPSGSFGFYALGVVLAGIWIAGAGLARRAARPGPVRSFDPVVDVAIAAGIGVAVFGVFVGAKVVADRIAFLADNVDDVLGRARTGAGVGVLLVALLNGVGEELFFRDALQSFLGSWRGVAWSVAVYGAVTIATLNAALVVAALALGSVLAVQRRVTGSVIGPIVTHLTWSTLIIVFLPR